MPPPGLDKLKHIVVLMMENRSFDHMLGALKATDPRIDGIDGTQSNPDSTGAAAPAQPLAQFQGQLDPDPDHHFPGVDLQIFNGDATPNRIATMQGFVKSYFSQRKDVKHSRKIMYYFTPDKLPVLTTLATEFAVFNRWFASIPGPTLCNRAFAHYGTSFGHVGMEVFYPNTQFKSVYQRLDDAGKTAKIYYFDVKSSSLEVVNLLQHQPQFFGTFQQFLDDCGRGALPDYSFIEPNYSDHEGDDGGAILASDQHPDHHVQEGERFIAAVYNAIRQNAALWESTALLIVYDEHGGIYDHVPPPACTPDGFVAQPDATGTGKPFLFDRLGVRVPAVLVSPWVAPGTVVGTGRVFEHASIPATATGFFLQQFADRSPREKAAETFLDLLTLNTMRTDAPEFDLG
jgi:phospholipase C